MACWCVAGAHPALRAARRILGLSRELPVTIARRAVLVNRIRAGGLAEAVQGEIDGLSSPDDVERLPDVAQDDRLESAGAEGRDVFNLAGDVPALEAVRQVVEALKAEVGA